jgi:predicted short-subunit dehydrogenase-like oxidoreductase (DUF2520 family)
MRTDSLSPVVIVGRGRLGKTLANALEVAGIDLSLVPGREDFSGAIDPDATIVFLAVPDHAVPETAERLLASLDGAAPAVAHLSGALQLRSLGAASAARLPTGSFHPFQPFAAVRPASVFEGATIAVESDDPAALLLLEELALAIGGHPRRVPDSQRSLYHASAVIASAYVVGLAAQAAELLERLGWEPEEALESLLPLISGAVDNLRSEGLPNALSGPVRRGDTETVRHHVEALDELGFPLTAGTYRQLGQTCVELSRQIGLDQERCQELEAALEGSPD